MRVPFNRVFEVNIDGSVSPKTTVQIRGETMGTGLLFGKGVMFAGIDIASMAGRDIEVDRTARGIIIKGFY